MRFLSRSRLATSYERHLGRHDRDELHVGFQWQARHLKHRLADVRELALKELRVGDMAYVVAGELRIVFAAGPGRPRGKRVSVGFSGPKSCRIGHHSHEQELVRGHCLKQWRLVLPPRERRGPAR